MKHKYPSTWHLPWSPNARPTTENVLKDIVHLKARGVVVTEKMDGENTTIYNGGYCHARSVDSGHHPSRTYVKKLAGDIGHMIPQHWRVCGENMFAEHSIHYDELPNYFLVFNVWNDRNECLSWKDTVKFCKLLKLQHVPVLYHGMWNKNELIKIEKTMNKGKSEGYVVRFASSFKFKDFADSTAKWVRENHVRTDQHWMTKPVVKNGLKNAD